ncbi:MAG: lytic transglycosylase domain-containing protein [Sphingomonadales bacterium]|nr:MAG: lytic transglycosylase domain-containing protein [Sphingomonadales bacterium]
MTKRILLAAAAIIAVPAIAHADDRPVLPFGDGPTTPAPAPVARDGDGVPDQLDKAQREGYRTAFSAIRGEKWQDAQIQLDSMKPGPLHAIARAELYTAKNSPKVELPPLIALLAEAPELPQADQISRMAQKRGATTTPSLPQTQRLVWYDAAPVRQRARTVSSDNAAMEIALAIQPYVKADDGPNAEALVDRLGVNLTPDSATEWQQKVAWIYYVAGDDNSARRVAARATQGSGDWVAQADWVSGLAAWRQQDCEGAAVSFDRVATRAADTELRSAGLYWGSRAEMACARPERVSMKLKAASQYGETFYGLLAKQALAIENRPGRGEAFVAEDWKMLERRPNVRVAAALTEIGENRLADEVIRYQAKIGSASEHAALTKLAGRLSLPMTQLWLSHNGPSGAVVQVAARYPAPNWAPDGGWRVDKNLVFAHTLQESRFNAEIRSAAGAMGLMQVKTGAATDVGRRKGVTYVASDLTKPSVNMEIGQSYLEQLRDGSFTGGLLPKVIAAYNAGPTPVTLWNSMSRDNGDPLLYIESIPYWETRGYVMTVLRNYWMYENQEGRKSSSREALTQGLWPRFPGLPGATSVKIGGRAAPTRRDLGNR